MIKTIIKKATKTHPLKHGPKWAIKKKLDVLWSQIVKKRVGGVCEVCGKSEHLNSHHIVGRRVSALRWDVKNGCCLCVSCHKFSNNSAHNNSPLFEVWMRDNRPNDLEYIMKHYNDVFDKDYIRIEEELREATSQK